MRIEGKEIIVTGMCPRTARLRDEWYEYLDTPEAGIRELTAAGIRADVFTFMQPIPDRTPRHPFQLEWCSAAVLPLHTYENWWTTQINDKTRNMVRKAAKSGVTVRRVEFNDDLVRGIVSIYNETPLRQGKLFKHYGKDFETIERTHITYLECSDFLGAFLDGELIGFAKLVHGANVSSLMQILCKVAHRQSAPANALIASAVEACTRRNGSYLHYGVWSRRGLGEFKQHHGFKRFDVPRYFVPLNAMGSLCLRLTLHRPLVERVPRKWQDAFVALRTRWYTARYRRRLP